MVFKVEKKTSPHNIILVSQPILNPRGDDIMSKDMDSVAHVRGE